jgi:hypothetical protein
MHAGGDPFDSTDSKVCLPHLVKNPISEAIPGKAYDLGECLKQYGVTADRVIYFPERALVVAQGSKMSSILTEAGGFRHRASGGRCAEAV